MAMLVLLACQSLYAQTNPLVGSWQIDVNKSASLMTDFMKDRYDSLDANRQAHVMNAMSGRVFKFNEDGTFEAIWRIGSQVKVSPGVWQHNNETGIVSITVDNDFQEYELLLLEDELRLRKLKGISFFTTLCFNRQ